MSHIALVCSQVNDNETKMKNLQTRSNITTSYMKFKVIPKY